MNSVAYGTKIDCIRHFGLNELGQIEFQFAITINLEKTANFKVGYLIGTVIKAVA